MNITDRTFSFLFGAIAILGACTLVWELATYDHSFDSTKLVKCAEFIGLSALWLVSAGGSLIIFVTNLWPRYFGAYLEFLQLAYVHADDAGRLTLTSQAVGLFLCVTATDAFYSLDGGFEFQYMIVLFNAMACVSAIAAFVPWCTCLDRGTAQHDLEETSTDDESSSEEDAQIDTDPGRRETAGQVDNYPHVLVGVLHVCVGIFLALIVNVVTEFDRSGDGPFVKVLAIFSPPLALLGAVYTMAPGIIREAAIRCRSALEFTYFTTTQNLLDALDVCSLLIHLGNLLNPSLLTLLSALSMILSIEFMAYRHSEHVYALKPPVVALISIAASSVTLSFAAPASLRRTAIQGRQFLSLTISRVSVVLRAMSRRLRECGASFMREAPRSSQKTVAAKLSSNHVFKLLLALSIAAIWSLCMGLLSANRIDGPRKPDIAAVFGGWQHIDVWSFKTPREKHLWNDAINSLKRRSALVDHIQSLRVQGEIRDIATILNHLAVLAHKQFEDEERKSGEAYTDYEGLGLVHPVAENSISSSRERLQRLAFALAQGGNKQDPLQVFWCGHFGLFPVSSDAASEKMFGSVWSHCPGAADALLKQNSSSHFRQDVLPSYYATRKSMLSRLECRAAQERISAGTKTATSGATCTHAAHLAVSPPSVFSRVFPLSLSLPQDAAVAQVLVKQHPLQELVAYIRSRVAAKGALCSGCPPESRIDGDGLSGDTTLLVNAHKVRAGPQRKQTESDLAAGFLLKSTTHSDSQLAREWHQNERLRLHSRPVIPADAASVANSTHVLTQRLHNRVGAIRARARMKGPHVGSNVTQHSRTRTRPGHFRSPRLRGRPRALAKTADGATSGHKARTSTLRPYYDSFQARVDALRLPSGRNFGLRLDVVVLLKPFRVYIHQGGASVSVSAAATHPLPHCSINSHAEFLAECATEEADHASSQMPLGEMLTFLAGQQERSTAQVWNTIASQAAKAVLAMSPFATGRKPFTYDNFALVGDSLPFFFGLGSQFIAQLWGERLSQAFQLDIVFDKKGHAWIVDIEPHHNEQIETSKGPNHGAAVLDRAVFALEQFWLLGVGAGAVESLLHPLAAEICRSHAAVNLHFEETLRHHFGGMEGLMRFVQSESLAFQAAVAEGQAAYASSVLDERLMKLFQLHQQAEQGAGRWHQRQGPNSTGNCSQLDVQYVRRFLYEHLQLTPKGWFRAFPVANVSLQQSTRNNTRRSNTQHVLIGSSGLRYPSACGTLSKVEQYQADRDYTRLMQEVQEATQDQSARSAMLFSKTMEAMQLRYEWYRRWGGGQSGNTAEQQPSKQLLWLAQEWFHW